MKSFILQRLHGRRHRPRTGLLWNAPDKEKWRSDFRDLTDLTRKFAIPVLEYLDKEKITMHMGSRQNQKEVGGWCVWCGMCAAVETWLREREITCLRSAPVSP